jgi:DNA (cytosine-5)-methyltransferase 1
VGVKTKIPPPSANAGSANKGLKNGAIRLPDSELKCYRLGPGCLIEPGVTVELRDHSTHEGDAMHSADFLRVKHIIMDLETDEVRLRGYRLRRTKYLGQIFDCK